MPRYFMNVRDGVRVMLDHEEDEYSSLQEARLDAFASAREMSADALKGGSSLKAILLKAFEIRNEAGQLLLTVRFIEALV